MKIDCQLDYQTILRNQAQPVHVLVKLTADRLENQQRKPLAFCVVLDRSGSMAGKPRRSGWMMGSTDSASWLCLSKLGLASSSLMAATTFPVSLT